MATTARGQITIVDLNDAKSVMAYLQASQGFAQLYNPDTKVYTPNYGSASNVITPSVYQTGNANNLLPQCSGFKYTVNGTVLTPSSSNASYVVGSNGTLTIKSNISDDLLNIIFECVFTDSETGVTAPVKATATIVKSQSAGALFQALIETPKGYIFNTSTATGEADLTAVCKCYRGGVQDTSNLSYVWEQFDIPQQKWVGVASGRASGATLTVKAVDVLNFQMFRVTVKDAGGTDAAATAVALVTFEDKTDPVTVELVSTTGDKIVNGKGSTTVMARLWQAGTMIESEATLEASRKYTYTWKKYDKDGAPQNWSGTTSNVKTGNPVTVLAAEVNTKTTLICEVTKK
jgi:hypothetical protein